MVQGAKDRPRRQIDRRAEAERRLLDAAAQLIGEIGATKMTLADIGERAGYSRGLPSHHFGSKGALLQRIIDTVTTEFHQELAHQCQPATTVDAVHAVVTTYFDGLEAMTPLTRARLALWAEAAASGSSERRLDAVASDSSFHDEIARRLETGLRTGELPVSIDPSGSACVLVAMLRGVALQYLIDDQLDLKSCRLELHHFVQARLESGTSLPAGSEGAKQAGNASSTPLLDDGSRCST